MTTAAIVIGIDTYHHPAWALKGAVRDALAFARWVSREDDLDPAQCWLLVSGHITSPLPGWTLREPTRQNILEVLRSHYGAGASASRLFIFYAGHACTPPTRSPEAGPLLVPQELTDLSFAIDDGVDLTTELSRLRAGGPPLQLVFVDGCREIAKDDALVSVGRHVMWKLDRIDGDLATQAVLYATRSGLWANELGGRGVFTRALLEGLSGCGPALAIDDEQPAETLPFGALGKYVADRVKELLEERRVDPRSIRTQIPTFAVVPGDATVVVRSFAIGEGPRVKVRVRVDPGGARRNAEIDVLYRNPVTLVEQIADTQAARSAVTTLALRSGVHTIRIGAPGFASQRRQLRLRGDHSLFVELTPEEPVLEWIMPHAAPAWIDRIEGIERLGARATGRLAITSHDPHIRIFVRDDEGEIVAMGRGQLYVELPRQTYTVESVLPGLPAHETTVVLDRFETLEVGASTLRPGPVLQIAADADMLGDVSLDAPGHAYPSESIGTTSDLRLSSLLTYAAWAAAWRAVGETASFRKLSRWGIEHPPLGADACALSVLLGDACHGDGTPFALDAKLSIDANASSSSLPPPRPLTGIPFATQTWSTAPLGSFRVRLDALGLAPTTFACAGVRGFVTVLVVTREEWGDVEAAIYLVPLDPRHTRDGLVAASPDEIRPHELAARALLDDLPVLPGEYARRHGDDPVRNGRWSNPLAAIIAGYRLWRTGRIAEFEPTLNAFAGKFPELDDLQILSWLHQQHRDMPSLAPPKCLPLVAMGLRELLREHPERADLPLGDGLVPGTLWTTFAPLPRAKPIRNDEP